MSEFGVWRCWGAPSGPQRDFASPVMTRSCEAGWARWPENCTWAANLNCKKRRKKIFAQGQRFSARCSRSYKCAEGSGFHLEVYKKLRSGGCYYCVLTWSFAWLKLEAVWWFGLFSCRRNPFWQGSICDHSCISLNIKLFGIKIIAHYVSTEDETY